MGEAALAVGDIATATARAYMSDGADARRDNGWALEALRSQIDIACGRLRNARLRTSDLLNVPNSTFETRTQLHQIQAELELWSGDSAHALDISRQTLGNIADADERHFTGNVLNLAMRSCADLHQVGVSRRADTIVRAANQAARDIRKLAGTLNPVEIVMHSSSVVADAEVTEWQGELARLERHPRAVDWWSAAASSWETLGRPHRVAYARWRQGQALLERGDRRGAVVYLRRAMQEATHHEPLRRAVADLAHTAGLGPLTSAESPALEAKARSSRTLSWPPSRVPGPGSEARPQLTVREGQVIHLAADGLTSEQIGRRLNITERTVRKHLGSVYAKAGVQGRAAAAAWWQRRGQIG